MFILDKTNWFHEGNNLNNEKEGENEEIYSKN